MNTHQTLTERRTIHRYTDRRVPEDVLERGLHAAHHAPCHRLTFPWRFILAGSETRVRLADLGVELKRRRTPLSPEAAGSARAKLMQPDRLVVACQVACPDAFRAREDYAACSCAIQNLMLSLAADGVGSKWSSGALTRDPGTYRICGVDPGEHEIIGFVWAGYARATPEVERLPLESVVTELP